MTAEPIDEASVALVRDALAHLYDYPYLLQHPLAERLGLSAELKPRERMRQLRAELIQAVEQLRPADDVPLRSAQSRSYQVLTLHYVESMLIDEVARELAISPRQVYRDLRRAEEDLAALLGLADTGQPPVTEPARMATEPISGLSDEAARLAVSGGSLPIGVMLTDAREAVQALAQSCRVGLTVATCHPSSLYQAPVAELARHALVALLSQTVKAATPATTVAVRSRVGRDDIGIEITLDCEAPLGLDDLGTAVRLLTLVKGELTVTPGDERCTIILKLPIERKWRVLLIDDNAELGNLFERYLLDTAYVLTVAHDPREGLTMARTGEVDVIVLDVMMPGRDGWSLLQQLVNDSATAGVPVVVCSVIHDPELAASLGAVAALPKPVTRADLLQTLGQALPLHLRAASRR